MASIVNYYHRYYPYTGKITASISTRQTKKFKCFLPISLCSLLVLNDKYPSWGLRGFQRRPHLIQNFSALTSAVSALNNWFFRAAESALNSVDSLWSSSEQRWFFCGFRMTFFSSMFNFFETFRNTSFSRHHILPTNWWKNGINKNYVVQSFNRPNI